MRTLGLDLSLTCTGAVVLDVEPDDSRTLIHSKTITTKKDIATERIFDVLRRANYIATHVMDIIIEYNPDMINIEGMSFSSQGNATRDIAVMTGIVINRILSTGLDIFIIPPSTLKKFATGRGNAKKEEMVSAITQRYPAHSPTILEYKLTKGRYDIADAFWLAVYPPKSPN